MEHDNTMREVAPKLTWETFAVWVDTWIILEHPKQYKAKI